MGQIIDGIIIIVIIFFAVRAGLKGFIEELFSLLAFLVGYFGSVFLYPKVIALFGKEVGDISAIAKVLIIGALFVGLYLITKIIEVQISKLITVILLSGLNKLVGIIFGVIEAVILIYLLSIVLVKQDLIDYDFGTLFAQSKFYTLIETYIAKARVFFAG